MLIIKRKRGEDINKMLKRFKSKVRKVGLVQELKSRQSFTKKSVKRRKGMDKARWVQSIESSTT